MPISLDQIDVNQLYQRQNAFYTENISTWQRSMAAYGGGSKYIKTALIQHTNEIPPEYAERLKRACYINYPRRVATLITQFVLARRPTRENANDVYVEDFSRTGMRVDEVMRQFSTYLNICGCAWLCIDAPAFDGQKTRSDELRENLRPYCVALSPLEVPDWHYGDDGKLDWVLTKETKIDNSNPFANAETHSIRKLWMKDVVIIVDTNDANGDVVKAIKPNPIGVVPFIRHVEVDGFGIGENHWYEDVVRISDAILNANSEAQMNVLKQMFGLLVIPEDFLDTIRQMQKNNENSNSGASDKPKTNEPLSYTLARSAALFESQDAKGVSRYIQPAGTETTTIRNEVDALRKELYSVVGLTTSNVNNTKLVESADAKAWDFQNMEAYMQTRADVLEQAEFRAWEMLNKWNPEVTIPTISYNRNFAILDLKESVATLLELSGFCQENDPYQRSIGKAALAMLNRLYQLPADTMQEIEKIIDESTPGEDNKEKKKLIDQMKDDLNDDEDNDEGDDAET